MLLTDVLDAVNMIISVCVCLEAYYLFMHAYDYILLSYCVKTFLPHSYVKYMTAPDSQTNGFIFVKIQGGFHEIRNAVSFNIAHLFNTTNLFYP